MRSGLRTTLLAITCCAACSARIVVRGTAPSPGQLAEAARCRSDADCKLNPVDCSECGRCPGDEPVAATNAQIELLRAECARHPPVRLDPKAGPRGLTAPACSPCMRSLNEPLPVWRAVCREGTCAVEQKGVEQPGPAPGSGIGVPLVSLDVSAPFSHSSLTIDAQGKLDYSARSHVPIRDGERVESKSLQVTREQIDALKKLITEANVFSEEGRWNIKGEDCVTFWLRVAAPTGERPFSCTCDCPPSFDRIRSKLEELLGQPMLIEGF
jgi:hypothetical protein